MLLGDGHHLAMDKGSGRWRGAQRQTFNEPLELGTEAMLATIGARDAREAGEPLGTVALKPALQGPYWECVGVRQAGKWNAILKVRAQQGKARERIGALRISQRGQGGGSAIGVLLGE